MKIIIEGEEFQANETQAQVVKDFLTNDEFSIFRYGYSLGMRDELTLIVAKLQSEKEVKKHTKKYLGQINALKKKVRRKQRELDEVRELATCIGAIDYSKEVVNTTKTGDTIERKVIKIDEVERELNETIEACLVLQHTITREINLIENETLKELLFMRYVEGMKLEQIATKMNYSFSRVRHLHGIALLEFEKKRKHAKSWSI